VFSAVPGLRPTPDRVRETVFNWLAPYIEGARVLDLFAGSGILGFEAISRGASSVTAVDNDPEVVRCLRRNAGELDATGLELVVSDVGAFLDASAGGPFDIVFVDPPHAAADYDELCRRLEASTLPAEEALIYVEHSRRRAGVFHPPDTWQTHRSGRAGDVVYQLWRRL